MLYADGNIQRERGREKCYTAGEEGAVITVMP